MKYVLIESVERLQAGSLEQKIATIECVLKGDDRYKEFDRVATFEDYAVVVGENDQFLKLSVKDGKVVSEEVIEVQLIENRDAVGMAIQQAEGVVRGGDLSTDSVVDLFDMIEEVDVSALYWDLAIGELSAVCKEIEDAPKALATEMTFKEIGIVPSLSEEDRKDAKKVSGEVKKFVDKLEKIACIESVVGAFHRLGTFVSYTKSALAKDADNVEKAGKVFDHLAPYWYDVNAVMKLSEKGAK